MKLNLDLANIKQPQQIYDYTHKQSTLRHLDSNSDQNCSSKGTENTDHKALSWVSLRGKSALAFMQEHNQDENERDLLRSMFGGPTKKPSELLI